ncbi:box C/D snoRNA protein 1-like, partial [Nylanderia fulva]|uniref:box C/D snoRNA protein 1-like n=1 Tax=Nylanderia fulva TaxID=613905 RepID=UPI0010FBB11C
MASACTSDKLEDCEVCGATKAKYTCPKCEVRTCSLVCVNLHKKELDCDGIRDKTKFIPLSSFGDLDLLSDYRFLEQVGRLIDTKKRNPEKKYTRHSTLPVVLDRKKNIKLALADKLQFYRAAGLPSIKVLLKAEKVKKANS